MIHTNWTNPKFQEWKDEKGRYHREDGPALSYGTAKIYCLHGYQYANMYNWLAALSKNKNKNKKMKVTLTEGEAWYFNGKIHNDKGPAIIAEDGTIKWYRHGKRHRDDGPAIEHADGTKKWYQHGQLHREDGPAIEDADGTKEWFIDGKRHREDGPAFMCANFNIYFLKGRKYKSIDTWLKKLDISNEKKVILKLKFG